MSYLQVIKGAHGRLVTLTRTNSRDSKRGRTPVKSGWQWRGEDSRQALKHLAQGRPLGLVAGTLGAGGPHKGDGADFLDQDDGGAPTSIRLRGAHRSWLSWPSRTPGRWHHVYGPAPREAGCSSWRGWGGGGECKTRRGGYIEIANRVDDPRLKMIAERIIQDGGVQLAEHPWPTEGIQYGLREAETRRKGSRGGREAGSGEDQALFERLTDWVRRLDLGEYGTREALYAEALAHAVDLTHRISLSGIRADEEVARVAGNVTDYWWEARGVSFWFLLPPEAGQAVRRRGGIASGMSRRAAPSEAVKKSARQAGTTSGARRLELAAPLHEEVWRLRAEGLSIRQIKEATGMSLSGIRKAIERMSRARNGTIPLPPPCQEGKERLNLEKNFPGGCKGGERHENRPADDPHALLDAEPDGPEPSPGLLPPTRAHARGRTARHGLQEP